MTPLSWYRPTFIVGNVALYQTPLGRLGPFRIVFFQSFADLLEDDAYGVMSNQHHSRFLRFVHAARGYVFYLAHYVGFKMRKPFKCFRIIDLGELLERDQQGAV